MLEQQRAGNASGPVGSADRCGARLEQELTALREQLERRTRQLEASELRCMDAMEAAQRQSEIMALYAHDLRSPLSAIIGYAELLEMGVPESIPDCAVECVSRIREAAHDLQSLLDEVLTRSSVPAPLR